MSKKANRKSVIGRTCNAMMESLERRVLFDVSLPNPPVPTPVLPVGTLPLQGLVGTPISLSPAMMRTLYSMDNVYFQSPIDGSVVAADGSGQTIAIVDAYGSPTIVNDVQVFDQQWDLSNADSSGNFFLTVTPLAPGANTLPVTPTSLADWSEETSLDVEWAHVMAPKAHILLVTAPSPGLLDLLDADVYAEGAVGDAADLPAGEPADEVVPGISPLGPSVVSDSWGIDVTSPVFAGNLARFDGFLVSPVGHQGVTVFAASGDVSANLEFPSSSIEVVGVGGSSNNVSLSGARVTIGAWAGPNPGEGSGGGPDTTYTSMYNVPMVSMEADPRNGVWIYDSYQSIAPTPPLVLDPSNPGWYVVGGTSLACPLFAGYFSTIQQGITVEGEPTLATSTTFDDLETAGEANPFYFVPQAGIGAYPLTVAPPTPTGTTGGITSAAIPNNNHRGFGDPVTNGSGVVGFTDQLAFSTPEQETDGLTDLFLSNYATDFPIVPDNAFTYLLTYTGKKGANTPLDLQMIPEPGGPILSYFPAPSNHETIDSVDEANLEDVPGGVSSFQMDVASFPSTGLPVVNGVAGQAIGGAGGFDVDVDRLIFGGIDTSYNGIVTLALTSTALESESTAGPTNLPFGAGSVTTVLAVNGVANFNDVIIDQAGEGYILTAVLPLESGPFAGGYFAEPAQSTPFNITPAAVSQLIITTEPISTFQFADVPVIVSFEDPFGNIIIDDSYSTVDLTVNSGPAPFSVPVEATAVNGVATFDLTFGFSGTYTLLASDVFEGFTPAISSAFVISPVTTQQRGLNGTVISAPGLNEQQERNGPVQATS